MSLGHATAYGQGVTESDAARAVESKLESGWTSAAASAFRYLGEPQPLRFNPAGLADHLRGLGVSLSESPALSDFDPSPEAIAAQISRGLREGPLVAIPPWGGGPGKRPSEFDWLARVERWDDHLLGMVVPTGLLGGGHVAALWKALPMEIRPLAVLTGRNWFTFLHSQFQTSLVILGSNMDGLVRMFKVPDRSSVSDWMDDFDDLWRRQGGRTRFGYVLREPLRRGDPLQFERHDPAALARAADLSAFGETRSLSDIFEVRRSVGAVRFSDAPFGADEIRIGVVSGRDIGRDGALSHELSSLVVGDSSRQPLQLAERDIVVAGIFGAGVGGFRCAEVTADHLPAVAGSSVLVLRPNEALDEGVLNFVLDYLRSPLAVQVYATTARSSSTNQLNPRDLSAMKVPLPDGPLTAAIAELSAAAAVLASWHADAQALLGNLFQSPSATAARAQLLQGGRHIRMRAEVGARLDDFNQTVRSQFPYPIAYRWRSLDALNTGPDVDATFRALLDTFEVLLCYTAQIAMTMARHAATPLGEVSKIREKLSAGRHGLGLGDWSAILDEVAGRRFSALPDDLPLGDVRRFLRPGSEASKARIRLSALRNDQAHLRPIPVHELPAVLDSALADLTHLMREADFLVDLPLIHLVSSRWDSLASTTTLRTRHLMGDHPVVPYRTETSPRHDLEDGSLYVGDSSGGLHLLRPLLIGRECPACQTWSTFHIDGCAGASAQLKSLEHGHVMVEDALPGALRAIGLL